MTVYSNMTGKVSQVTTIEIMIQATVIFICGCNPSGEQAKPQDTADRPDLPVVTDSRTDLLLSWFADGGPITANAVAGVPDEAKKEVRVQDPQIPPEKRDPKWIFLADLTATKVNGRYPVRAELRTEFEVRRRKTIDKPGDQETSPAPAEEGSATTAGPIIMYATKHCPVCTKARRWLLERQIPYIERDVERDAGAAEELARKGKAQGVPTSGVPVFDIRGRLVPGFDPALIQQALAATRPARTMI